MGIDSTKLPWADDALMPGESLYALVNKLAWFAGRRPLQLLRDLRSSDARPYQGFPTGIEYSVCLPILKSIEHHSLMPSIHGLKFYQYLEKAKLESDALPSSRSSCELRYCPSCLGLGMHFEFAQLEFIDYCPRHKKRLISYCKACGDRIRYSSVHMQGWFACATCANSFLSSELTDLRSNLAERKQAAGAYAQLARRVLAAPKVLQFAVNPYKVGRLSKLGLRHAMGRMLEGQSRGGTSSVILPAHYVAVSVERTDQGTPRLKRHASISVSDTLIADVVRLRGERRLAQCRVGAWAIRHFHEHLVCMCAARAIMKKPGTPYEEFTALGNKSYYCSVGRGFAVWEANQSRRELQPIDRALWNSWGLDRSANRLFAYYILEKAFLANAIMMFVDNDHTLISRWGNEAFALELINDGSYGLNKNHAIVWFDLNLVDISDCCELYRCKRDVQLQWLGDALGMLTGDRNASGRIPRANRSIAEVMSLYDSRARLALGEKWMLDHINRRARLALRPAGDLL